MTEAQQKAEAFLAEYKELCIRHGHVVGLALTGPVDRLAVQAVVPALVLGHVGVLTAQLKKDHEPKKSKRRAAVLYEDEPVVGVYPPPVPVSDGRHDPVPAQTPVHVPPTTIDSGAGDWGGGSADAGSCDAGGGGGD